MAVQITLSDLREKVDAGWKKPALAEHYGIPVAQMTKALQEAGLTIRKFHHPKFELVDDTQQDPGDEQQTDINDEVTSLDEASEDATPVQGEPEQPQDVVEENTTSGQW